MDRIEFKVNHFYLDTSIFKESLIYKLNSIIQNNITINDLVEYLGCGVITFDDSKHETWNVEVSEKFTRGKNNAIVYKVRENELLNPHKYNYLVIFYNNIKGYESYGYVWINTNDSKTLLRFCLEFIDSIIPQHIIQDINCWKNYIIYELYNDPDLTYGEYKRRMNEYYLKYKGCTYDEYNTFNKCNRRCTIGNFY